MAFTLITRSLIIYLIVFLLLRLMGKRQIGEMQPFELVITLIIADLATIPMAETALPLIHGIIPIITLALIHFILTFLSMKSVYLRKLINGKPVIVVNPNGIDHKSLKRLNMNVNDLMENLRGCGYFNLEEVLYAIMQTNGTLTVLPRSAYAPLNASNVGIKVENASLPIILISEGKVVKENMEIAQINNNFLVKQLGKVSLKISDIFFISINTEGKMYIQPKTGEFKVIETNYQGDGKW
ncbi:MAG: DUF421 domain-containing protein [Clostridia bacterium]|nr:DUF421 domain-containing protein [Clostridia bacterium]